MTPPGGEAPAASREEIEALMRLAVEKAREGISRGQTPFGCAIASGGAVRAVCHNTVLASGDITAHAEVTALREAARRTGALFQEGAIVATTCEPCPMCMAALHWARVGTVYFGAGIADARAAGFNELSVPAAELLQRGGSSVRLEGGVLADACRSLFREWSALPGHQVY